MIILLWTCFRVCECVPCKMLFLIHHHFPSYFFIVSFCDHNVRFPFFSIACRFSGHGGRSQLSLEVSFVNSSSSFRESHSAHSPGLLHLLVHLWSSSARAGGSLLCASGYWQRLSKLIARPHSQPVRSHPLQRWNWWPAHGSRNVLHFFWMKEGAPQIPIILYHLKNFIQNVPSPSSSSVRLNYQ